MNLDTVDEDAVRYRPAGLKHSEYGSRNGESPLSLHGLALGAYHEVLKPLGM